MPLMTFLQKTSLTPLHMAVIENDLKTICQLKDTPMASTTDAMGFTPLDLARLLAKKQAEAMMKKPFEKSVSVIFKGAQQPAFLALTEIAASFEFDYLSHLTFHSYDQLKEVVALCPYLLRFAFIAKENHAWGQLYSRQIHQGVLGPVRLEWIDEVLGYGLFAEEDLDQHAYVGEYTGVVRSLDRHHSTGYCLSYPTHILSRKALAVDAMQRGNLTRFINHSEEPTLIPRWAVDRNLVHQVLVASRHVKKGEQLTCNYGEDYWQRRTRLANVTYEGSKFSQLLAGHIDRDR
jgi:hypothetical protein